MKQYRELVERILGEGVERGDRTGTGTLSVFGHQARFDLGEGFPLVTLKRTFWRGCVEELLWFVSGSTNERDLSDRGVNFWREWAREDGDLGPVYGRQWRGGASPSGFLEDQIAGVIQSIQDDPESRRHIVTAWRPEEIPHMALAPCHTMFQFYVHDGKLSCQLYQRSADVFLGVPVNIASYALLTHMIAQVCDLGVGEFVHTFGDAHLYLNHIDQAREMLGRRERPLPRLVLDLSVKDIDSFTPEHIALEGYDPHPTIKAPVAV